MTARFDHVAVRVDDAAALLEDLQQAVPGLREITSGPGMRVIGTQGLGGKITLLERSGEPVPERCARLVALAVDVPMSTPRVLGDIVISPARTATPGPIDAASERQGIVGITIAVADPPLAVAQLAQTMRGEVGTMGRDMSTLELGHFTLTCVRGDGGAGAPIVDHIGVAVADLELAIAARQRDGAELLESVDAPISRAAFFSGPNRMRVELIEHKPLFAEL